MDGVFGPGVLFVALCVRFRLRRAWHFCAMWLCEIRLLHVVYRFLLAGMRVSSKRQPFATSPPPKMEPASFFFLVGHCLRTAMACFDSSIEESRRKKFSAFLCVRVRLDAPGCGFVVVPMKARKFMPEEQRT